MEQQDSATGQDLVLFDNVWKIYRIGTVEVRALAGVSFSVSAGEYVAVIGPSGSGKTTLLNLLGCLDRPTQGRYVLGGRDVASLSDDELSEVRSKELGFIFQSYNLIPQLSVIENIGLPLFYQGVPDSVINARAVALAERVGLGKRLHHRPTELSGGQQQRVAIARALINEPHFILADEPTGNLDSATGREIMEILADLNREGTTIIIVTHDARVAACTRRVLRMLDGRIEHEE